MNEMPEQWHVIPSMNEFQCANLYYSLKYASLNDITHFVQFIFIFYWTCCAFRAAKLVFNNLKVLITFENVNLFDFFVNSFFVFIMLYIVFKGRNTKIKNMHVVDITEKTMLIPKIILQVLSF